MCRAMSSSHWQPSFHAGLHRTGADRFSNALFQLRALLSSQGELTVINFRFRPDRQGQRPFSIPFKQEGIASGQRDPRLFRVPHTDADVLQNLLRTDGDQTAVMEGTYTHG